MNTKTLISALVLALGLGTLALPGTAAARDYERDGDRQEHRRDRHDNDRGDHRRHDNGRHRHDNRRGRYDHRDHNRGPRHGRIRWIPYVPRVRRHHDHHYYTGYHRYTGGYDPQVILHIDTRW